MLRENSLNQVSYTLNIFYILLNYLNIIVKNAKEIICIQ